MPLFLNKLWICKDLVIYYKCIFSLEKLTNAGVIRTWNSTNNHGHMCVWLLTEVLKGGLLIYFNPRKQVALGDSDDEVCWLYQKFYPPPPPPKTNCLLRYYCCYQKMTVRTANIMMWLILNFRWCLVRRCVQAQQDIVHTGNRGNIRDHAFLLPKEKKRNFFRVTFIFRLMENHFILMETTLKNLIR